MLEKPFMTNERALIEACVGNDRMAQRRLYELYAGKLFVVALRYVKNKEDAQDVLQIAFVKIFKSLDTFRFDCPFEPWLRKVIATTALKHLRDQPDLSQQIDIEKVQDDIGSSETTLSGFSYEELLAMIAKLPDGCRTVFNLYAMEGYQHDEISDLIGVSVGTSKSQYSRAKMLLQTMINKEQKYSDGTIREI